LTLVAKKHCRDGLAAAGEFGASGSAFAHALTSSRVMAAAVEDNALIISKLLWRV
jgi:hypothetical protein